MPWRQAGRDHPGQRRQQRTAARPRRHSRQHTAPGGASVGDAAHKTTSDGVPSDGRVLSTQPSRRWRHAGSLRADAGRGRRQVPRPLHPRPTALASAAGVGDQIDSAIAVQLRHAGSRRGLLPTTSELGIGSSASTLRQGTLFSSPRTTRVSRACRRTASASPERT